MRLAPEMRSEIEKYQDNSSETFATLVNSQQQPETVSIARLLS